MRNAIVDVINMSWPTVVIVVVISSIMRLAYIIKNDRKSFRLYEELFNLMFIVYLLVLFQLVTSQDLIGGGTNLTPFKEIFRYELMSSAFIKQVLGNIVLFVPLGYFVSYYCKIKGIVGITIVSLLSSVTIEIVQHFIGRSVDIDDVILNVIGGIIGFLLYKLLKSINEKLPNFMKKKWFYNLLSVIIILLVSLYLVNTLWGV
ncbi:MAG: VanZ family protein [Bacilli bacterium]|nr:VanZ family protein [Bacilli bacterium]